MWKNLCVELTRGRQKRRDELNGVLAERGGPMEINHALINAAIAEKVMGDNGPGAKGLTGTPGQRSGVWVYAYCDQQRQYVWMPLFFSTDPAASKQLRDKMRADGWIYQICSTGWSPDAGNSSCWMCQKPKK